jgi:hypothetical protein
MVETKDAAVDEAAVESLFDQRFQIAHAKHRNRALPTDPDVVFGLR